MCVIMAELEDREHDAQGLVREWLARGSRAPRDAMWIADGHMSKQRAPVSPVTGKLDAYRWHLPAEQLSGRSRSRRRPIEPPPPSLAVRGAADVKPRRAGARRASRPPAHR